MNNKLLNELMKILIPIITFLALCFNAYTQSITMDSCGLDNSAILNSYEVDYFFEAFNSQNVSKKDLADKRIYFATGNYGSQPLTKQEFFDIYARSRFEIGDYPQVQIIHLTEEEKQLIPEYDEIIVCWSKISAIGKARKKFIANVRASIE